MRAPHANDSTRDSFTRCQHFCNASIVLPITLHRASPRQYATRLRQMQAQGIVKLLLPPRLSRGASLGSLESAALSRRIPEADDRPPKLDVPQLSSGLNPSIALFQTAVGCLSDMQTWASRTPARRINPKHRHDPAAERAPALSKMSHEDADSAFVHLVQLA
jgi:hypothetical protein